MQFLAKSFTAGNTGKMRYALKNRWRSGQYRRAVTVGDIKMEAAEKMLREADCSVEEAEGIYKLTSFVPLMKDRNSTI